jgi:hypothetical protein
MRLFVSLLLFAAASAAFGQSQISAPLPAQQAAVKIAPGDGLSSRPTIDAFKTNALTFTMPQLRANPDAPGQRSACYTMRNYRFMREDPSSDATKLKSYSTCQAATGFRMRDAAGSAKQR